MSVHQFVRRAVGSGLLVRVAALLSTVALATACGNQPSDNASTVTEGTAPPAAAASDAPEAAVVSPPADGVAPPAAGLAPAPAQGTSSTASKEIAARDAKAQAALAEQKAINQQQAETNARLQAEVERLKPREVTLAAGTVIPVRTIAELSTENLTDGGTFEAQLDQDLLAGDVVVAKAGSRVNGIVVTSDKGGKVKGVASLTVGARAIVGAKNKVIPIKTDSFTVDAKSTKKKDAVRTGVASGIGAVVGGIAGGGKGAAIGAGVGAGAGVATNMATRGESAVIPSEQLMPLKLTAPVTVSIQP